MHQYQEHCLPTFDAKVDRDESEARVHKRAEPRLGHAAHDPHKFHLGIISESLQFQKTGGQSTDREGERERERERREGG